MGTIFGCIQHRLHSRFPGTYFLFVPDRILPLRFAVVPAMILFMLRCGTYYWLGYGASGHSRDRGSGDVILALAHVERPELHRNHCRPHGEFMLT